MKVEYEVDIVDFEWDDIVVGRGNETEKFQTLDEAVKRAMQIWNHWCRNDKENSDVLVNKIVDGEYECGVTSAREIENEELEQEKESVIKNFIEEVGGKEITISEFDEVAQRIFETRDSMVNVPFEVIVENDFFYSRNNADDVQVEVEVIDLENKIVKLKDVYYI